MSYINILLDKLTDNYNKATDGNIAQLFTPTAEQMDELNTLLNTIDAWYDIDTAEGTTLDKVGKNVNESRNSLSDSQYRLLLKTKIKKNTSKGDINSIIEIVASLLNLPVTSVNVQESYPAGVIVSFSLASIDTALIPNLSLIATYIKSVLAGGIGLTSNVVGSFTLAPLNIVGGVYVPIIDNTKGFGISTDLTIGGKLGGIIS